MDSLIEKLEQYLKENYPLPKKQIFFEPPPKKKKEVAQIATIEKKEEKREERVVAQAQKSEPKQENPILSLYSKIAPSVALQPPPTDEAAKKVKQSWKDKTSLPDIPIFFDDSVKQHTPFLSNIASAISASFSSSLIYDVTAIEKENRWEALFKDSSIKFLLIPDVLLWKSPHLITYYREVPGQLLKRIAHIPLFLLQDLDAFYKSPELKSSLWNVLSQHLRR